MKLSTLFWGVLFLLIGALFLLNNLGYMDVNWGSLWRLWPMILIFWGLSLVFSKRRLPWYVVLLLILLMVFMLVASVTSEWFTRDFTFSRGNSYRQSFAEPYSPSTQRATFRIRSGAGSFKIRDTTSQLLKAETEANFGRYSLSRDQTSDEAYLTLDFRNQTHGWNFGGGRNTADVELNSSPTWDITAEVGAASVDFDLRPYKVDQLKVSSGASSLKLRLGDRSDEARVVVGSGASSIVIEVPESVGCELKLSTALSGKRIRGFDRTGDNRYETSNFDTAKKKIYLDVEAGVSSVRVDRYQ